MAERLTIIRATTRINRALRQERRLQAAHRAEVDERKRVGHVKGWVPDSVHALYEEFQDELYFLIVAIRQAVASRTLIVELGHDLPPIQMEGALVAWRDIYEHWDDAARGDVIRAESKWLKSGATGSPGGSWSYGADNEITTISGVSLPALRADLTAILVVLGELEQQAFDDEWPTPEDAAEFMHMDLDKFLDLARWGVVAMDWDHRGAGLRYRQSDLVAWKARLVEHDAWPPSF